MSRGSREETAKIAETPTPGRLREPQQQRSRSTVESILAAADVEIGRLGLAGTSTRVIARRAGVSVGALYRFFRDKDEIADALARQYLDDVTASYTAAVAHVDATTDLGEVVRVIVQEAAALQLAHPGYYRLTEDLAPEELDSPAHQVREHLIGFFAEVLGSAGVTAADDEVRRVLALSIETVRHTLVRAPAEEPARSEAVEELWRLVSAYVVSRFG